MLAAAVVARQCRRPESRDRCVADFLRQTLHALFERVSFGRVHDAVDLCFQALAFSCNRPVSPTRRPIGSIQKKEKKVVAAPKSWLSVFSISWSSSTHVLICWARAWMVRSFGSPWRGPAPSSWSCGFGESV